jgi:hypothetical protein
LTERSGWGASGPVTLPDGTEAFAKRLPLTEAEVAHPRSTRNRYRLPTYYSYGVGSAGFGAWRELAAHERVSGLDPFPRLLEWRVQPRTPGDRPLPMTLDEYVTYWNGNVAIEAYMRARAEAQDEVWIASEQCGLVGYKWIVANQDEVDRFLVEVFEAVAVLRGLDIVHFDAHLGNVVVSDRARLADFGLAMDATFELSAGERRFLDRHRHYDAGTVLGSLGQMLMGALGHRDPARLASDIDHIDELPIDYSPPLRAVYRRCREPILYMVHHFDRLFRPAKRSRYDDADLAALLRAAGIAT